MSKIGKQPVLLPQGVKAEISGGKITISGPKGSLTRDVPESIEAQIGEKEISFSNKKDTKKSKSVFGTTRSHIKNAVLGVSEGWVKTLELIGTGYRAEASGNMLTLTVGFSHPVKIALPDGVSAKVEKTFLTLESINKELLGQIAAAIRQIRPPEPYKGKGIRYKDEVVRRKPGKAAKAQGVA